MEFNLNYQLGIINEIEDVCLKRLKMKIYEKVIDLEAFVYKTSEPVAFNEIAQDKMQGIKIGESWGGLFDSGWFKFTGFIDQTYRNVPLYLHLDLSGEGLLYDENMMPLKGFTNGSSVFDRTHGEPGKEYYQINQFIKENGQITLWVEAGCNDLFGNLQNNGTLQFARIVTKNNDLEKLYYDLETLISLLKSLKPTDNYYLYLFNGLNEVKNHLLYETKDYLNKSLVILKRLLTTSSNNELAITAVGHGHLDLAWLWPIRESKRKVVRTITNVLYLLKKYPQMVFVISQPQQLIWLKEQSSYLFNQVKGLVKKGQIELVGGMFVEADTNISNEESLCRQILYGVKYFEKEFGVRVDNLWLPDVFGYNGALPQIMKKSGLNHFMTIKISWNLVNKFPYHTMLWEGIDGTKVLTHMPPEGTYNSSALPRSVLESKQNYQQMKEADEILMVYGIGNGGGGPGDEHLERIIRQGNLLDLPKVKTGRVDDFFKRLELKIPNLPIWQGELYLENHQGTYTSQSNIKRYNHLMENKLKAVETYLVHKECYHQYREQIDHIWQEVLLYQFHDILPGSSIKRVYDEALSRYEILVKQLDDIIKAVNNTFTTTFTNKSIIYNHHLFDIKQIYKVNNTYHELEVESLSTRALNHSKYEQNHDYEYNGIVETKNLIVKFNQTNGYLDSIIDKRSNQEILKSPSNKLRVYQDFGDAWNILDHYRKQDEVLMTLISQEVKDYNVLTEITNRYRYQQSTLTEVVLINKATDLITFTHDLDWQDLNRMLRTSFDTIVSSDDIACDIQFGYLNRTRLDETSTQKAQFEICAQNWVNIKDEGLSISLYKNAKYGHYVKGSIIDLNLLRSTNYPCENGDIGKTTYQYALLISDKQITKEKIDDLALSFNASYLMFNEEKLSSLLTVDQTNIEYSTIKGGSDNSSLVIRFYEKTGHQVLTKVTVNKEIKMVKEINIVEEDIQVIKNKSNSFELDFKPFEIKTIQISL